MRVQAMTKPGMVKSLRHKFPNTYERRFGSTSPAVANWGFNASLVSFHNYGPYPVYFNFVQPQRGRASERDPMLPPRSWLEVNVSEPISMCYFRSGSTTGGRPMVDLIVLG